MSVTEWKMLQICLSFCPQHIPKILLYFHEDIFIMFRLIYMHHESVIQQRGYKSNEINLSWPCYKRTEFNSHNKTKAKTMFSDLI